MNLIPLFTLLNVVLYSLFFIFMVFSTLVVKKKINDENFLVNGNKILLLCVFQFFSLIVFVIILIFLINIYHPINLLTILFMLFLLFVIFNFLIINFLSHNKKFAIYYALFPTIFSSVLSFIVYILAIISSGIGAVNIVALSFSAILISAVILLIDFFSISFIIKSVKNWKILSYVIIFLSELSIIYIICVLIASII